MTPVYNFTWRGEDAFSDHGVCTMSVGSTVVAERRDKTWVVAGRPGLTHCQDGAAEEVERVLKLYFALRAGTNGIQCTADPPLAQGLWRTAAQYGSEPLFQGAHY